MPLNMQSIEETLPEKNVVTMNEYSSPKKSNSFELVMSQMNIPSPKDFDNTYTQKWQSSAFEKQLLSILICEIDYLDEYVAHYGEQGASFMLVSMALTLKNLCDKHNCFLARNEQQGFSLLMQGGTPQEVQAIANEICMTVKNTNTAHLASPINKVITLSIGVSSFYPVTKSLLNAQVNHALLGAKKSGGNRVVKADSSTNINIESYGHSEKSQVLEEEKINRPLTLAEHETDTIAPQEKANLFSESLSLSDSNKTYRGQAIQNQEPAPSHDALQVSNDALNEGEVAPAPKKKVRYYRGQIIQD